MRGERAWTAAFCKKVEDYLSQSTAFAGLQGTAQEAVEFTPHGKNRAPGGGAGIWQRPEKRSFKLISIIWP